MTLSPAAPPLVTTLLREPYRLLFPLGLLQLIAAVTLWPIAAALDWQSYPGALHVGLAVHGLLACFVIGFLGTMAPNLLRTPPAGPLWVPAFVAAALGGVVALFAGATTWAAGMLALSFLLLLAFAVRCRLSATRPPPARMAAIAVAAIAGAVAAVLGLLERIGTPLPISLIVFGAELRQQGVIVLLVAGIAGLLLPRFAGGPPDPVRMASAASPRRMLGMVLVALAILAILASYWLQAFIETGGGHGTLPDRGQRLFRALLVAVLAWPAIALPRGPLPAWLRSAQFAVASMVLGVAMPALDPARTIAWHHLIFISGFLWLTLMIAARVVTAHSGRSSVLDHDRWPIRIIGVLIVLAVSTRIAADYLPQTYRLHLVMAALCLLPALLLWGFRYVPMLWSLPPAHPPEPPA